VAKKCLALRAGRADDDAISMLMLRPCLLCFFGVQYPEQTIADLGLVSNGLTAAFILHRLMATLGSPSQRQQLPPVRLPEFALPRYTVIVALYREANVVPRLCAALSALDYPKAKLDIIMVLEQDDPETRAALLQSAGSMKCQIIVAPLGEPRTKPRALNIALPFVRGEFLCVYDAEDVPDPDQLQKVVATFAASPAASAGGPDRMPVRALACVQAKLAVENITDSLLTRFFAIEYAGLFDVLNSGLSALGLGFPLGGTSNHFRTEILRKVGGWDAWNVTEDADLGIRLIRSGYRSQMVESTTWEEAPVTLRAWMGQRRRWIKGWMQTLIVHSRYFRRLKPEVSDLAVFDIMLNIAGTLLTALTAPASTLFVAWLFVSSSDRSLFYLATHAGLAFSVAVSVLGVVSIYWTGALGIIRRRTFSLFVWLPLLPFYFCLVSYAAWWSIYDLIMRPFVWNKTAHGQTRFRDGLSRRRTGI